ncbi:MAG TPA: dihydrofolate reductase family protein [Actinomycetota bacterium]|nr:dihydrofolate reductase family protein [Actinomycetota bacterium]
MRRLVWMMSVSLDGFIAGPNGELDWQLVDEELHREFNHVVASSGAMLEGRVMHEMMAGFWPTADQDPANPPAMVEFAGIWRETPKIVYSRTLTDAAWNATLVPEVVAEEVLALKAEAGSDLLTGGADLAGTFLRLGLIDEFRIYVHPAILGAGTRMLPPTEGPLPLRLVESRTFTSGVVLLRYETAGS